MILTSEEITALKIVEGGGANTRSTTFDATVKSIVLRGVEIDADSFSLPPRGVVWLVSKERFLLPDDVTGLATLRTTWTHEGLLALNVGVVDPGWEGPLAAVVVNFGSTPFTIHKNDAFLRVLFHRHKKAKFQKISKETDIYTKEIVLRSRVFADTFLDIQSLVKDVSEKVMGLPRWAFRIGFAALICALVAIFVPIAIAVFSDYYTGPAKFDLLQKQIDELKKESVAPGRISQIEDSIRRLEQGP